MSKYPKPKLVVDAKGFRCPIPALRVSKFITQIEKGEVMAMESTDHKSRKDIPILCEENGWEYLDCIVHGDLILHIIRR